jgi:hypothetical protein
MGLHVDHGQKHVVGSPIHVLFPNIGVEVHDRGHAATRPRGDRGVGRRPMALFGYARTLTVSEGAE